MFATIRGSYYVVIERTVDGLDHTVVMYRTRAFLVLSITLLLVLIATNHYK